MDLLRWVSRWPIVMLTRAMPAGTRETIWADVRRWRAVLRWREASDEATLLRLFGRRRTEFRNLYYFRLRRAGFLGKVLANLLELRWPPLPSLHIAAEQIGPGLFIQHGFSTIIAAESIGSNCWVNQQVTIGHVFDRGAPVIGDDVVVGAGAIVVGPVRIGDGARVGAGTTVVRDVPAGMTAVSAGVRLLGPARSPEPNAR